MHIDVLHQEQFYCLTSGGDRSPQFLDCRSMKPWQSLRQGFFFDYQALLPTNI
jgi:hypothetical protein